MRHGIQSFQMSGGIGDWIEKADQMQLYAKWSCSRDSHQCQIPGGLTWNSHINKISSNANKTLGFLKWNNKTKMSRIWGIALNTLMRPQLEYPHTKEMRHQIEKVQDCQMDSLKLDKVP